MGEKNYKQVTENKQFKMLPWVNDTTIDWRANGKVSPVQNQGMCGSCWAFAAAAAMESSYMINSGASEAKLAEQQFVDCDKQCSGCQGGLGKLAFAYAKTTPIVHETDYPYQAKDGQCNSMIVQKSGWVKNSDYYEVAAFDVNQLKSHVFQGPTVVSVAAGNDIFRGYKSGILNNPACANYGLDHAVVAVGFGVEDGTDYFIVRNSWSATWGEQGYIRMAAVAGKGTCGMNTRPVRPNTVAA